MHVLILSKLRRLMEFMRNDWAITRRHFKEAVKFCRSYQFFKSRGFTHKAAMFNARNAL
jgi:hypothetical protein